MEARTAMYQLISTITMVKCVQKELIVLKDLLSLNYVRLEHTTKSWVQAVCLSARFVLSGRPTLCMELKVVLLAVNSHQATKALCTVNVQVLIEFTPQLTTLAAANLDMNFTTRTKFRWVSPLISQIAFQSSSTDVPMTKLETPMVTACR